MRIGHGPRSRPFSWSSLTLVLLAFVVTSSAEPVFAQGDPPPSPSSSAVLQYSEFVPTSEGGNVPGVRKKTVSTLPKSAKKALAKLSKSTATALTAISVSSDYGAPNTAHQSRQGSSVVSGGLSDDSSVSSTVATAGNSRMIGLLVALVSISLVAGTMATRAQRRQRR